ncbi:MAG TPA: EAL domain-containing protein, partial [Ilumatobacter sp.]|nr:EAL domain-containing protein [Ilumatobacter sp.]
IALVAAAFAVLVLVQRHVRLARRHRDLEAIHAFALAIGRSIDVDAVGGTAVVEAARILHTDNATLLTFTPEGSIRSIVHANDPVASAPTALDDPLWAEVLAANRAVMCSPDGGGTWRVVEPAGPYLAVPVSVRDHVGALLLVGGRSGASRSFSRSDRERADDLASHLASALYNANLHATVEHAASHDVLTGNRNRASFERAIRELPHSDGCTAVFMLDLNRFKEINDTLGHHVGDRVLVEFARRLRSNLQEGDVGARFGGDEFAVLVRRDTLNDVMELADRIEAGSFAPMSLDGLDVVVTASIGVAVIEPVHRDAVDVLRRADVAMYLAKRSPASIELYRPDIDRRTPERLSMLAHIRESIETNSMEVHYQPKVDLITNTVVGAEALIRWDRPGYGPVEPVDLIRVAEESGIVKQITDYVLRRAIAMSRHWYDEGYDLTMAINLSTHDLLDEQLPNRIEAMLQLHGLSPERLILEITESALLLDTPRTLNTIDRLSRTGVRLSLDDFGTGYSSLGYLRRLPVSELKIDRSFVKNLLLNEQDAVIVKSTIDLSHNLGLQVVAEGVENGPTLDRLRELSCDIGQGHGIARALPSKMFRTWLRTTGYHVARPRASDLQR